MRIAGCRRTRLIGPTLEVPEPFRNRGFRDWVGSAKIKAGPWLAQGGRCGGPAGWTVDRSEDGDGSGTPACGVEIHSEGSMHIHVCGRCDGSGHLTGGFQWEVPWTRWAADAARATDSSGILRPHACSDCGGAGALLEVTERSKPMSLPSRRGLPAGSYSEHVARILQRQAMRGM